MLKRYSRKGIMILILGMMLLFNGCATKFYAYCNNGTDIGVQVLENSQDNVGFYQTVKLTCRKQ